MAMYAADSEVMKQKDEVLDLIMRRDPGNRGLLAAVPPNPVAKLRESLREQSCSQGFLCGCRVAQSGRRTVPAGLPIWRGRWNRPERR